MTAETRQIYQDRIADASLPEGLRKFYKKMLQEPPTRAPATPPPAFLHFLNHLNHQQDENRPTNH